METNILAINDNETSIQYRKSKTDNNIDLEKHREKFDDIIKKLMVDHFDFIRQYDKKYLTLEESNKFGSELKELYDIFGFTYKIENFDDIFSINHMNDYLADIMLEICDLSNFITIIDKSGNESDIREKRYPAFIKIKAENEMDILVAADNNHYISDFKMQWQSVNFSLRKCIGNKNIQNIGYYDGWKNSQSIINEIKKNHSGVSIDAFTYCNGIEITLDNGKKYKGYLPMDAQFGNVGNVYRVLNDIFRQFGYKHIDGFKEFSKYWTGNEIKFNKAGLCSFPAGMTYVSKQKQYAVWPFFKEITNNESAN